MSEQQKRSALLDLLADRLSAEERERLEDQLLTDDDLFDELAGAEDDLVDAFVRGDLEEADERVLERFVTSSPRARESAELGAALNAYPAWRGATRPEGRGQISFEERRARWVRRVVIGIMATLLALLVVLSLRQSRTREALEQRLDQLHQQLEEERERAEDLERRLAREEAENRLMRSPE